MVHFTEDVNRISAVSSTFFSGLRQNSVQVVFTKIYCVVVASANIGTAKAVRYLRPLMNFHICCEIFTRIPQKRSAHYAGGHVARFVNTGAG